MIKMENVTKVYENGAVGLRDLNLQINRGEFVFVVGSSGSGKSTFIRLLLKEVEPTDGNIIVNGTDITTLKRRQIPYLRRKIGVVFQDFRLLPSKTVYENVAFAMQVVETNPKIIRRNVPQILAMVGLAKKINAYPNQLSGGEQQRVALARAIINRPPILLADEPTGNLDPDTAWEIMDLIQEINRNGTTVVISTHAKDIVDKMQKRVVAINKGVVLRDVKGGGYSDEAENMEILY
ncbi:MAG: cell division ATP-binding protein FtsE [Clostridia bacterium]|nr:cell division ATP-binding protein FtsE [Clostridia bacterium]